MELKEKQFEHNEHCLSFQQYVTDIVTKQENLNWKAKLESEKLFVIPIGNLEKVIRTQSTLPVGLCVFRTKLLCSHYIFFGIY